MSNARPVSTSRAARLAALVAALVAAPAALASDHGHRSGPFAGAKADRGTVTHQVEAGRHVLVLSDDFKVPDAPDPHWQIVDSKGTIFLLDRLIVKPEQTVKRRIVLPAHVTDVSKVQMWCAYAETLLGEASYPAPIATRMSAEMMKKALAEARMRVYGH
jgi:hypothetical protein